MNIYVILFVFAITALIFDLIVLRKIYKKYERLKELRKEKENDSKRNV